MRSRRATLVVAVSAVLATGGATAVAQAAPSTVLRGSVHGTAWRLRASVGEQPCATLSVGVNRKAPASRAEAHECFEDFLVVGVAVLPRCRSDQKWLYGVAPRGTRRVVVTAGRSRRPAAVSRRLGDGVFWSAVVPGSTTDLRVTGRSASGETLDAATVGAGGRCDP